MFLVLKLRLVSTNSVFNCNKACAHAQKQAQIFQSSTQKTDINRPQTPGELNAMEVMLNPYAWISTTNFTLRSLLPFGFKDCHWLLTTLKRIKFYFFLHEKYVTHVHKRNMQNPCHRSGMEWNVCFILGYDAWYSRFESIIIPMTIKDQSKKITKQLCWVVEWEGNIFFIQMLRTQKVRD